MIRLRDLLPVAVGAGLALACGVAVRSYDGGGSHPRLATADIASIIREQTLALAAGDLDDDALRREAAALRHSLTVSIDAWARTQGLVILPANAGVFGAPDVTGRLRDRLAAMTPDGASFAFEISAFHKHCLLNGLDDIGFTMAQADAIQAADERRAAAMPWLKSTEAL